MAKSTYISENLNEAQIDLLKYLEDYEILYFNLKELELPKNLISNVNELVENLYQKGLLNRIERGVYAKPNYNNVNVLATYISSNSTIAYWSALHHHGLTERFPNIVFVKTTQRKRDTQILGSTVKFVTVKENKNIGAIQEGYGDDSFTITDIEMTLVDCLDQPRYAGDFTDVIKAFANAKLTNNKLIEYTKTYDNIALTKRVGYLATLFHEDKLQSFINYAKSQVNKRYSLIDAGGLQQGEFISEWKLRLNISKENLLQMAQTEY
ncbi:type IV toxin-antitoxin system AbiEi family antitoxin domain-containing protein [Changchengzhania lutea]|uniref:type IV toxin-antitoxin system AbiEi family antitoxin domain-containing protein n=1 Tax=Changchengzhania lutea TaxID=2049305 RepID=UPI00115EA38B|nr:type IV toxin-antitoxin system AbiEi family antitoxin [Changchengzhania lutea]